MTTTEIVNYASDAGHEQAETTGKFLQILWRDVEYLLFAPLEVHRYHNQILARFLLDHGIVHRWLSNQEMEFDEPELTVVGGGRFRANTTNHTLVLWDDSQAYGRFDDSRLAERISEPGNAFSGFRVRIS